MYRNVDQFEFSSPDTLVFGRGCVERAAEFASGHGETVLVVTDRGIRDAGLTDDLLAGLQSTNLGVECYDQVTPDPTASDVRDCRAFATEVGADVVIGIGGGSPMDVAKGAAILASSDQPIDELYGRDNVGSDGLPLILIPTTSGTGSEVSTAIVLYDDHGEKQAIVDEEVIPEVALVDPVLSTNLPRQQTAATGLDAFSHAMGSYISTNSNSLADTLCVDAMDLIDAHLRTATHHGAQAPIAREKMALAATTAMLGRVNGGKAAIHSVAYGLQEMYDLPHGEAISMILPEVVEYNLPACVNELAALGTRIYDAEGSKRQRAWAAVDGIYQLRRDVGLEHSLTDVGGEQSDLDQLSQYAVHSERHLRANPRELTKRDARGIFQEVLDR